MLSAGIGKVFLLAEETWVLPIPKLPSSFANTDERQAGTRCQIHQGGQIFNWILKENEDLQVVGSNILHAL